MKQCLADVLELTALSPAARTFVEALAGRTDLPEQLVKMARLFWDKGQHADARLLVRAARALEPNDYRIRAETEWLRRWEAPNWHFNIIHDQQRNEAYARAIKHFVQPGMTVFEIGTGTGILAMLAVQAGARHVYTCERRIDVAEAARAIIELNGFSDRITVIAKDAHAVQLGSDLPERADIFVAELVDNSLLGEGVLPLTELARSHFLKPDAILLPREIMAMGYLVSGRAHCERYRMTSAMGFDLAPFNRLAPMVITAGVGGRDAEPLSEPVELARFNLRGDTLSKEGSFQVLLTASKAGIAEGVMRWLRLDFGAGIAFENRPPQQSAWSPELHILPKPLPVHPEDPIEITVQYNRNRLFIFPSADNVTALPKLSRLMC